MARNVIHVSKETHTKVKKYCEPRGIQMKIWLENLIFSKLADLNWLEPEEKVRYIKRLPELPNEPEIPFEALPPFWEIERQNSSHVTS
jgi:hypothetical protein